MDIMDIMDKYEPIYSHMSKYRDEISNEELGKRVKHYFERHQQYVEQHRTEWEEKGKSVRSRRMLERSLQTAIEYIDLKIQLNL